MTNWKKFNVVGHYVIAVPFLVSIDVDEEPDFDPEKWMDEYNQGNRPDDLEGVDIPYPDVRKDEVVDFVIDSITSLDPEEKN